MDKIASRVRKLLALAHDNSASQGEIENAMRMARELMTQYGIEDSDLQEDDTSNPIVDERGQAKNTSQRWEQSLSIAISNICDVVAYRCGGVIHFVGYARDVAVARELYPSLVVTARTLARMELGKGWTPSHRSFAEGFVSALISRSKDWKKEAENTTAIVVRKDVAIREWLNGQGLKLSRARRRGGGGRYDAAAAAAGSKAGNRIALGERLGAGSTTRGAIT